MFKSILLSAVILLLLAGLTYSQDSFDGDIHEYGTDEEVYNPPYNPDWASSDVLVYNFTGGTSQSVDSRTMDMEYCEEDGRLYVAFALNITSFHGARVYSSSNSGASWTFEYAVSNASYYWTNLSMTVDQSWSYRHDSVRVNLFCTRSAYEYNNDAHLRFYSMKPHVTGGTISQTISSPAAGNKYDHPSAYSNGQFNGSGTDIGCIVGEYNNAGTSTIRLKKYYMLNWSWTFTNYNYTDPYHDVFLSAVYKNNASGTDSVYIATERRWAGNYQIRIIRTRAFGGGSWPWTAITTGAGQFNRKPCLTIPQNRYPTRMAISYTQRSAPVYPYGFPRYSNSYNGGASWTHGNLPRNSFTTRHTWVSSDSNGSSGYCTFVWGDTDSLNVRRGTIVGGSGGTTYYNRASNLLTGIGGPVCAVYNNSSGNHRRSAFAYWGAGPEDVYANAENLPTGITNTNGIASTYSLSQNYPNPFNPTTSIKFSIPQDGLVKLVVFDMLGKEVATLVNDEQTAGNYEVTFDASKLTSGVYFYKITSGDFSDVKKMILVK